MRKILRRGAGWLLVVRESVSEYERSVLGRARNTDDLHALLRERLLSEQVEVMCVVLLDGQNRVIGLSEVARGGGSRAHHVRSRRDPARRVFRG